MTNALNNALVFLTRREHSVCELQKKLEQKGYDESEIENAVQECQRLGYQSDERFAEQLIRNRIGQGYGPVRIKQELLLKGVSADLIKQILTPEDAISWVELGLVVAKKKYQSMLVDLSWEGKQKLKRFLLYRGFSSSIIFNLFDEFF